MTLIEHTQNLGGLLANFHSLEFILRAFLHQYYSDSEAKWAYGTDIYDYSIGAKLPENSITNYESLGQLINKYNLIVRKHGVEEVDLSLIDLRDALAHGRTSAFSTDDQPLRLIKFSRPTNGEVEITFNCLMTKEWFNIQKDRVYKAIMQVAKGINDSYLFV